MECRQLRNLRVGAIQNDRRTIRERMMQLEPFPVGAFEKLVRSNVWKPVLEYLDPASLTSAYASCSTFKCIAAESVLVHVLTLAKNTESLYLHLRKHLDNSYLSHNHDVWNLRLVSHAWKRAAEEVYFSNLDPSQLLNYKPHYIISHVCVRRLDEPQHFPSTSLTCPKLSCRVVHLSSEYVHETLEFLDLYGALVQVVCYTVDSNIAPQHRYSVLFNYMRRLPSLKHLILEKYYYARSYYVHSDCNDTLADHIKANRLPTIPTLKSIRFESPQENELILTEMLRANPQVKCLQLPHSIQLNATLLCCMTALDLDAYRVHSNSTAQLEALSSVPWDLNHLSIRTVSTVPEETLSNLINRFLHLNTLVLESNCTIMLANHSLELPCLRRVTFGSNWFSYYGLDFLQPCSNLEVVRISEYYTHDSYSQGKLLEFRIPGENSVVWEHFTRLVCVRVEKYYASDIPGESDHSKLHYVRRRGRVYRVAHAWDCHVRCK